MTDAVELSVDEMAREVALDLQDGQFVNLGIGLPQRIAEFLPPDREIVLHAENGVLGAGPPPTAGEEDWDLIDAGKRPITLIPGGSYTSHSDSFVIVRGGHLDACVIGAYQVSARGDLANWTTGRGVPGVGGAMDLAVGARSVRVLMAHQAPDGNPKLVETCSLPLTAAGVVTVVYTNLGIFAPSGPGFTVHAVAAGVTREELQARTGAPLSWADRCTALPRPAEAPALLFPDPSSTAPRQGRT